MPAPKTIATELAVGLGLLRLPFSEVNLLRIQGTSLADARAALAFKEEFPDLVEQMRDAGMIASSRWVERDVQVVWSGPVQRVRAATMPADLRVYRTSSPQAPLYEVSVKCGSKLLLNGGIHRLIKALREGAAPAKVRGQDWFMEVAPDKLNELYLACDGPRETGWPTVSEFYRETTASSRKAFGVHAAEFLSSQGRQLNAEFGRVVSQRTLELAQSALASLKTQELRKLFAKFILRMDETAPYLVVGSDSRSSVAHRVPSFTDWASAHRVLKIHLSVNPEATQPELHIELRIQDIESRGPVTSVQLRAEIRWSHRKFCGAPEGKVYRAFSYEDLPWVESA